MKIEMTTDLIGDEIRLLSGDIVEMDKGRAVSFIQAGYAKAVVEAVAPVASGPTQESVEAELTALGVAFLRGADLGALITLLNGVKAEPRDGDGDGNVLDGTPAERPKRKPRADQQSEGV